jgi:hypothetical protein
MADDIKLVVGVDYTELTGLVRTTNQTKTALGSMAKSFAKTGDQKQYMRGINQLVTAQKNLDQSSRMSRAEIMKLGNQMRQQAKFAQSLANATKGAAVAQMAATKSSNRMGVVTQQAGYQVSDFIVQVQSGTNAFVAFGQQASQLVGVLPLIAGPLGLTASAAVGLSAGLGIAIPLVTAIGAALSRTSKDAEEAKNEIDSLADSLDKFELAQKALRAGMTVGQFTLVEQLKDLDQQIDKTKQKITDLQSGKGGQTQLGAIYEAGGLQEDIKADQEKILKLEELRDRVLSRISVKFEDQKNSLEDQNEIQRAINKYGEDSKKVQDIRNRQALIALDISAKTKGFSVQQRIELINLLKAQQDLEQAARVSLKLAEQEEASTKRSVDLHEKLADTRSKEAKDRQKAVQKILDTVSKEYDIISDKLRLVNQEYLSDKDSAAYQRVKLQIERDNYEQTLKSKGVLGDNLRLIMNQFDSYQSMLRILKDINEEEKKRLDAITLQQRMVGIGVASGRGGDPRQQGTRYQQEFGYKTVDELIAEHNARNKGIKETIDLTRELTDAQKQQVAIADSVSGAFGDFFMGLVDGTTSAKDAFRAMAADIIQQLYRILVVEQLVQSIAGAITGSFAPASAAGTKGTVAPPKRPTGVFGNYDGGGYTGSGPRSGGLDGKGGFMAMLHPRETVVDHTKGQGAGGTVVNQVFNISANTSDDTKRLITQTIAQASPAIINQSVGAVMNQRRRGGAMKSAFG